MTAQQQPFDQSASPTEMTWLDLSIALAKRKVLIVVLVVGAGIVAAIASLLMTPVYTAVAKLLPPQQSQSVATALISQAGQLGALASGALGLKNPSDIYVGMLKSRTIADGLIDRFNLTQAYESKYRSEARRRLAKLSDIKASKDGMIDIEVDDTDPKRAAAIANAYIEELTKLSGVLAVTEAGQRRLFFEKQLAQAKDNLLKAEIVARDALEKGGLAAVDAQGRSIIQTSAVLRARVAAKEVEINSMRGFATEQNPQFARAQQELAALREQLAKTERGGESALLQKGQKGEGIKNVGLLREVRYQEVLFELLARQYEIAKVDEAREGAVIQILDKAIEPDRRSSPQRTLIVLGSMALAFLAAIVIALLLETIERAKGNPAEGQRLEQLGSHLFWKRRSARE